MKKRSAADEQILKEQRHSKKEKKKEQARTEEDFDQLYKQYEAKLIKKLEKGMPKGPAFEEADI